MPLLIDWSSFLPDLIVGVVTGLIVGGALYVFERSRRAAETRSQALGGWLMVAPRIERIVWRPLTNDTTSYLAVGPTVSRVREIADGYPIQQWQQILRLDDLQALLDLISEYDALSASAERAEGALQTACFHMGIESEIGGMVCVVARTQTYMDTDEELSAQFAPPNDFMLKFVPLALSLRKHVPYEMAEQLYMGARIRTYDGQLKFFNAVRLARAESFTEEAARDERRRLWRVDLRHPITALKRRRRARNSKKHDD